MICKILSNTILFVINVEEIFNCTSLSIVNYLLMNQAHLFFFCFFFFFVNIVGFLTRTEKNKIQRFVGALVEVPASQIATLLPRKKKSKKIITKSD